MFVQISENQSQFKTCHLIIQSNNNISAMAYFQNNREYKDIKDALNSTNMEEKKTALKKVIAQMTVGKDLSSLFQPVIKCLQFNDLEIKKLVYLFVINYSKTRPDDAIMVVNLFRKDALNKANAIIRALAVRTMSSLRAPKLSEYIVEVVKQALQDSDPYVRKTAVLAVPKICEINKDDPQTLHLIETLQQFLQKQPNSLVLANAISSLVQISSIVNKELIEINSNILTRLLIAVNQCVEWGQVFILDFLATYDPKTSEEAEMIIDRVMPRLSHINPAVVFAAVKVMIRFLDFIEGEELIKNLSKKIGTSIVSLVSMCEPEAQYVLLTNIIYIIQKRPLILQNQIKCFFCKFTQPYYIKNQKIQILIRIVNWKNYEVVLHELKEYMTEGDPEFIRKAIKAIGKIAVRFQKSVDKCLQILTKQIIQVVDNPHHAEHVVNQVLIAVQNILRKNPSKFDFGGMSKDLVKLLPYATESESKEAAIWVIGEYAEEIYDIAIKAFQNWVDSFKYQQRSVQLKILSSAVKVFIKYPGDCQTLITSLLQIATQGVNNPDVRDRAFIYWRMLSTDYTKTQNTILEYQLKIKEHDVLLDSRFLDEMIKNMGTVSSVFEKLPQDILIRSLAAKRNITIDDQTNQQEQKERPQQIQRAPSQKSQEQQQSQPPSFQINTRVPFSIPVVAPPVPIVQKTTDTIDLLDM